MKDLHNSVKIVRMIDPQAVGTTGAANGSLSVVVDRKGYNAVEILALHGTAGATGDTTTAILYESDSATAASFTSVADADLIGTEAAIGLPAQATARASGVGKNIAKGIGYRGTKRYLRLRLYGLGHATGLVGAVAVLSEPHLGPVTQV